MSRVLLGWELGSNLGHLSRLLPLGVKLRDRGHDVLVAVRDVSLATEVLAPAGIRFVQAPRIAESPESSTRRSVSFADLLLLNGWDNPTALWGLVQAWGNVLRLFTPSVLVLDYAPAVLVAARILALPCALLGTGFELAPLETPLPAFPGIAGTARAGVAAAETRAVHNVNGVLEAYGASPLAALKDLFRGERRWLTTFPELDQYGPRPEESYVGPIGALDRSEPVAWPRGFAHRVLAYLRPGIPALPKILRALVARSDTAVICAAPGVPADSVKSLQRPGFEFFSKPVSFPAALREASLFLSYGPAASVTEALLLGIPQLIVPAHVEAQMTAIRVQSMGAGMAIRGGATEEAIGSALQRMLQDRRYKVRALEFARRHRGFDPAATTDRIVSEIEQLAVHDTSRTSAARRAV